MLNTALSIALSYTGSQLNPDGQSRFIFFTVKNRYTPYINLALALSESQSEFLCGLTGLGAAIIYTELADRIPWVERGPALYQQLFPGQGAGRPYTVYEPKGSNRPAQTTTSGTSSGTSSGFASGVFTTGAFKGRGRRLGS